MAFERANISLTITPTLKKVIGANTHNLDFPLIVQKSIELAITAGNCDRIISDRIIIPDASTPQTLDLNSATAKDMFGDTATMAKACVLIFINQATNDTHYVQMGGGTNPFIAYNADASDIRRIAPLGGFDMSVNLTLAGWACGSTAKNIQFDAEAGTNVPVDYIVIGRSA